MKTLGETTALLHRVASLATGLTDRDLRTVLGWMGGILRDLEKLHRDGRWHGEVSPDAVRVRGDRARLDPPGCSPCPAEFRDPDAERLRHKASVPDPACEARQDVYGVGALLYFVLENGPPPCGALSVLTRPAPPALAWVVARAMVPGDGRYPTARAMRDDLEHLLRAGRGAPLAEVTPESLPSHDGGELPRPRRLVPYRKAVKRERRATFALVVCAVVAMLIFSVAWMTAGDGEAAEESETPVVEAAKRLPTLPVLLAEWRTRLSRRLAPAGEVLDAAGVPILVVSDVALPHDLGWVRHPGARLARDVGAAIDRGASPAEVRDLLREGAAGTTVPAALRVRPGEAPGTLSVTLDYRGLRLEGVATDARKPGPRLRLGPPFR
jgi:hypothetical protein